jgi:hypothetical protein
MADTNFAAVTNALEQRIRQKLADQTNRSTVTLNLLAKKRGKGKNVAFDATFGTDTGQIFDDGQVVSTFQADTEQPATLQWGEYGDAFKVTGRAEDASAGDGTELDQLFVVKLRQARMRAAEKINQDLWTGDGSASPQKIHGITATAGPLAATGIYAGINRASFGQWAGNVFANGGVPRALSLSLVQTAFAATFDASGKSPTFGLAPSSIFNRLAELTNQDRRFMQEVMIRGQKITLQEGWEAIEINGKPVFRAREVPSGTLAFFHADHLYVEFLPVAPTRMARGKVKAMVPLAGTPQEQMDGKVLESEALMAALIELPSAGNFDSWMLDTNVQLVCDEPHSHFLLQDLGT